MSTSSKRIWGWYAFDWASQPYHTLILTFIFGPYFVQVVNDPVTAQTLWAHALTTTGLITAALAPIIGALADQSGRLIRWVGTLSVVYVLSSALLWFAYPGSLHVSLILIAFGAGLIATELATMVTNAFLPSLGPRDEVGKLSGIGYAIGYAGGLLALIVMLTLFAEDQSGQTLFGTAPALGLDPTHYQGTRFVGPFTALWFALSMVPFFAWVKDPVRDAPDLSFREAARRARTDLRAMGQRALARPSFLAFLASSMLYRDALVGLYAFGGLYATGVLDWSVKQTGLFGILGVTSAMIACWAGGHREQKSGPKPIIISAIIVLMLVSTVVVGLSRNSIFGLHIAEASHLPDIIFYICGTLIGAAGGVLQSASRSMMVRYSDPNHPTEAFGLYALTGKATAFLAPLLIGVTTAITNDQRMGVSPIIFLFLLGLLLLRFVKKDGDI